MTDSSLSEYELTGTRLSPGRTEVDTGKATFEVGHDVNPVEYFLGSALGCLNLTGTMVARDMDIDIDSLEMTVEGAVNYATYPGKESTDRAGLQGVEVTLSVEAAADTAELEEWLAAVERRCPVTVQHQEPDRRQRRARGRVTASPTRVAWLTAGLGAAPARSRPR